MRSGARRRASRSISPTRPAIAAQLAGVQDVQHLVLSAIDRDDNRAREYDLEGAQRLVTMKLVGYTEAIHVLLPAHA